MSGRVHVVGNCMMDVRVVLPHLPRPGETLVGAGGVRAPGGKAVNQAVAAARAGGRVRLLAPMGNDGVAAAARAMLGQEALELEAPAFPFANDLSVLMVVPGGENASVGTVDCAQALDPARAAAFTGAARAGDLVLVQGNLSLETTVAAVGAAPAGSVVFNPSPILWDAGAVLGVAGVVVANEIEAEILTGRADPAEGARALAGPGTTAVVTVGARGCFTVRGGEVRHHSAPEVAAVDTSGCGDVFCGVLAAGLAAGEALATAVGRAQRAAALTATRPGAFAAIPSAAEMARL